MTQRIFSAALFIASLCLAAFGAEAQKKPEAPFSDLKLLEIFKDVTRTVPAAGEPYRIERDGEFDDAGVTDGQGTVITHHRVPKTAQEFILRLPGFGIYSIRVDATEQLEVDHIAGQVASPKWMHQCQLEVSNCQGEGFYWIRLVGRKTDFTGEPYTLTIREEIYHGKVTKGGYILLLRNKPPTSSGPITLRLCGVQETTLIITATALFSSATVSGSDTVPAAYCRGSRLAAYQKANAKINHGMPVVFSGWSAGLLPTVAAARKQREDADALTDDEPLADSNADPLSWLGALPAKLDDDEYFKRLGAVQQRVIADIDGLSKEDLKGFRCRRPEEVGPTPDMSAVNQFIDSYPGSPRDADLIRAVEAAARKGNWLALGQLFALMSQSSIDGNLYIVPPGRDLQLLEWLAQRKMGVVYDAFGFEMDEHDRSNSYSLGPNNFAMYAALHDSYPAQFYVGRYLLRSERFPDLRDVGLAMVKCARAASPAYARKFR